jgi:hypothetical protein
LCAKHRILRFLLGEHPLAGAALGIVPSSLCAKHRILRFLLGEHPLAGAALGIVPSSRVAG